MCGTVPYPFNTGYVTPDPIIDSPLVWSFNSEPNLHPMKVTVNTNGLGKSPGLILVDPFTASSFAVYGTVGRVNCRQ
jgi:hypothetical protein